MQVIIYIRKNDTGEVRSYKDEMTFSDDDYWPFYMWEEGSYSCDCNRSLFFAKVKEEPGDYEDSCSDDKYSVNIEANGDIIYREFV